MLHLVHWVLVVFGVTLIVTYSKIAAPLRRNVPTNFLKSLVKCPLCFGFWAGLALSLFGFRLAESHIPFVGPILDGAAASAVAFLLYLIALRLGAGAL